MDTVNQTLDAANKQLTEAIERSIHLRMRLDAITRNVREKVLQHSDAVVGETEQAMAAVAQEVRRGRDEVDAAEAAVKAAAERPTKKEVQLARCARLDPALYERRQREEEIMHAAIAEEKRFPNDPTKADAVVRARRIFANTTHLILSRIFPEEVPVA